MYISEDDFTEFSSEMSNILDEIESLIDQYLGSSILDGDNIEIYDDRIKEIIDCYNRLREVCDS